MTPRDDGDSRRPPPVPEACPAGILSRPGSLVICAGVGVALGLLLTGLTRSGIREGGVPMIWGMAALALMLEMGRHQPWQYVLTAAGIAGGAGTLSFLGTRGNGLPVWSAAAVWVAAVLGARGTARWILRRWSGGPHFGLLVLGFSSAIAAVVVELAMESPRWIPGVPAPASALGAVGLVQMIATPWFLEKRTQLPVIRPWPALLLGLAVAGAVTIRILLAR